MTLALLQLPYADFPALGLALFVLGGLLLLAFGGDWLTNGAANISIEMKISPVVVGLTVVSIATSMPEMATSFIAAQGNPGLALGNILGSNIANIGLILGVTALIAPLTVQTRLIRREVPILLGVTLLFVSFARGGFSRGEGLILLGLTAAYLVYVVRAAKEATPDLEREYVETGETVTRHTLPASIGLVLAGAVFLGIGAEILVGSCVEIAGRLGVSDLMIGLTVVAIGTSLPELAAAIAAARAGHTDICAGNIVGSNLFNILLIGGGVATFIPIPVDGALFQFEFPALVLFAAFLFLFFRTGHVVTRREGGYLIALYATILTISALSELA